MQRGRRKAKRLSHIGKGVRSVKDITRLFCCEALTALNLHSNEISTFEGLEGLESLKDLNLSANRILTLKGFPYLPYLESLNLASNGLVTCEGMPFLPRLKALILTHNRLEHLNGLEAQLRRSLDVLDLRDNPIGSFLRLSRLKEIGKVRDLRFSEMKDSNEAKENEMSLIEWKRPLKEIPSEEVSNNANRYSQITHPRAVLSQTVDALCSGSFSDPCLNGNTNSVVMGIPVPSEGKWNGPDSGFSNEVLQMKVKETEVCSSSKGVDVSTSTQTDGCGCGQKAIGVQAELLDVEILKMKEKEKNLMACIASLKGGKCFERLVFELRFLDDLERKENEQRQVENEFLHKIKDLKKQSENQLKQITEQTFVKLKLHKLSDENSLEFGSKGKKERALRLEGRS